MTDKSRQYGVRQDRARGVPQRGPEVHRRAGKSAGGLACAECGIVEHAGRWQFVPPPAHFEVGLCPACRRVRDNDPAGTLRIPASLLGRRDELLRLVHNVEAAERAEHPLERLMGIEESDGHLVVRTTGVHLARELAHKLARQLHRKPHVRYVDGEELVHVDWDEANGGT